MGAAFFLFVATSLILDLRRREGERDGEHGVEETTKRPDVASGPIGVSLSDLGSYVACRAHLRPCALYTCFAQTLSEAEISELCIAVHFVTRKHHVLKLDVAMNNLVTVHIL